MFAELIGFHLDMANRLARTQEVLGQEQATGVQREQFIAVLGHDLRNPLASIAAGVTLLRKQPEEARAAAILQGMETSVDRMNEMVGNLLDFTRGRLVGGIPLELKATDAAVIVRQVVEELKTAHPDSIIELTCANQAHVIADEQRIGQLVSNLVGNALVHGAEAEPVRVSCATTVDTFELRVCNGGVPIPPDVQATLFEPFERGQASKRDGLGLGLYIASTIARAHHGTLTVSSSEEETCFSFRMPVGDLASNRLVER